MVLGDSAVWSKTQAQWHVPDAVKILDWAHLQRLVHKAMRTARPGKERHAERRALYQTIDAHFWVGAVEQALMQLRTLRPAMVRHGSRHLRKR